jgi:hypothetical protein
VREEEVRTGLGHHLELTRRGAGEAGRAKAHLLGGDAGRLVRLDVRPQREPVQHAIRGHAVEVVREAVEVDQGARGLEFFEDLRCGGASEKHHECRVQSAECRVKK